MKFCTHCKTEKSDADFYPRYRKCKSCVKEQVKQWGLRNPEKKKENEIRWRRKNRGKIQKQNFDLRIRKAEILRGQHLQRKFWPHLTWQEAQKAYDEMLLFQGKKCAICQKEFKKTPHVDHDHITNNVRGLLCYPCNMGIGLLQDSPEICSIASEYLRGK